MIRARRPLRLACAARVRAAATRARAGWPPAPLRWRRLEAGSRTGALAARLAAWTFRLRQHLHSHLHWHFGPAGLRRPRAGGLPSLAGARGQAGPDALPRTRPGTTAPREHTFTAAPAPWPRAPSRMAAPIAPSPIGRTDALARSSGKPSRPKAAAARGGTAAPLVPPVVTGPAMRIRATGSVPASRLVQARFAPAPLLAAAPTIRARPAISRAAPRRFAIAPRAADSATGRAARQTPAIGSQPVPLEWRRQAAGSAEPEPAQWPAGLAPAPMPRSFIAAAEAPPAAATPAPAGRLPAGAAGFDPAAADRFADDVLKRVERRLRIERERRGL
jgi:hypothetical protein